MANFTLHRIYLFFMDMLDDEQDNTVTMIRMQNSYGVIAKILRKRRFIPKITGYRDVVHNLPADYFASHMRISRHVFNILLDYVTPSITKQNRGGRIPVTPDKQLLIFLWYLCNQSSMREVSELFGLPIGTVWFIFNTVVDAVVTLQNKIIRWPDDNRRQEISTAVQQQSGFPGVVGFLDGTHIRLSSAVGGDADYYNRKGYPSIQLQLTVDHELVITSAYTGWPGCTHDARVLRNSQLYQKAENGELFSNGEHLFADNAYPLRNWLISPFKNFGNLDAQQRRFNMKLSSQRQCVERANGHLKGRFRRLREIPLHNPVQICKVIIAACICHNLCVLCDDDIENYIENDVNADPNNYGNVFQNGYHGVARRMHLLQFA